MENSKTPAAPSAAKQIADQIRSRILDGTFTIGAQLPTEHQLAELFGVSRPTIREALKKLAVQNLITSKRGPTGGTFINDYKIDDAAEFFTSSTMLMLTFGSLKFTDVLSVRQFMEYQCCLLAMENWSDENSDKILNALDAMKPSSISDENFCTLDIKFHRTIIDATSNDMLKYMMYGVMEALIPVMNMIIVHVKDRKDILDFYDQLFAELSKKDPTNVKIILDDFSDYLQQKHQAAQTLQAEKKMHYEHSRVLDED
ncbi:MAG: GntR family transcriptional regulator [Methyloligella sp.]|nr:MAG: GntR family transcriptional regulator [Methyloligella sp.]